jgi:hypothetical protein
MILNDFEVLNYTPKDGSGNPIADTYDSNNNKGYNNEYWVGDLLRSSRSDMPGFGV